eukprot:jgi/Astpho2/1824/fgenesh1_pg.00038_%23_6_t
MQGSQRALLEQYWLGRHAGSGSGQMHPDAGSADGEGMHAALHTEQPGAEAWGAAAGLHGAHLEPAGGRGWQDDAGDARQSAISVFLRRKEHISAGACSRETLSRLSQLTLAGDHPAAGEVQKGHPPAGQPWRTRCPECQRLQVYDLVWQQADAKGSVEVAHLACCRSCRPQSEALLASLGRDQAGSQPAVSSSGTSSESADCRGRKMKRQASRLPVPRGRPRDPAGFQGQGELSAEAVTAASLQEPSMPAPEDAGLDGHTQAGGSRPGAGGLGLDAVALLRELQKRNISPQSAAAGAEGLSNPFEAVMRAAVKTEEPSAKRFKEGSPMKGFGSVLLGSAGSRLSQSLQASLSSAGLSLPSKEPSAMDLCRHPRRASSPVPAAQRQPPLRVAHSEPVSSLPPRVSIPLPCGPGQLSGLHGGALRQQEAQPPLEPTSTVDLALMTLLRAERVTLQHLQALLAALIQTNATEMWVQAISMLSQHLDKARQDTRTLREAQATWQGGAVVTGRPPLPGLAPSAAVPVPAAAAQAVVGMGSLWGSLASPGSSGAGAAARHGWHLQQEQRGELQRMEGELAAAAAQQGGAEQPTEGSASNSAPPQQPKGAARQLPEFSSSEPSGALSSVLAGPSLQAPGRGSGHLAVKEPAATPADQIQDVNRDILELLQRVGANEVVQQIFGFVSDAFAQHQSRSLVTERQLLAAMAATQQQGAAQQEQLQAALGALGSMHRAVQGVLSLPPQQTVSVKQAPTPSEQHLELQKQLSESESDKALLLQQLGLAQLKSSKLETEKDELAAQLKAAQEQLVRQQ